jgi:hypothetical protein
MRSKPSEFSQLYGSKEKESSSKEEAPLNCGAAFELNPLDRKIINRKADGFSFIYMTPTCIWG